MNADKDNIRKMFNFLSGQSPDGELNRIIGLDNLAFVFGRADSKLSKKSAELYERGIVKKILVTGGAGKDSDFLEKTGTSEAEYLASLLVDGGIPERDIILETRARNAGENCRFGLRKIADNKIRVENIVLVAHSTSLMRLYLTFRLEMSRSGLKFKIYKMNDGYEFDTGLEKDQKEAIGEMMRIIDGPNKGHCENLDGLGNDAELKRLVEYAKLMQAHGFSNYKG